MLPFNTIRERLEVYPRRLFDVLLQTAASRELVIYISGGALRDWILGITPKDLDFSISYGAAGFLEQFRQDYGGGTIVPLGVRHDDTCRLVLDGLTVDVSGFRRGSATLDEDLTKRDFTVNALAADLQKILDQDQEIEIVDPMDGVRDLQLKTIRSCPHAFSDDPLRLLRAFRFSAVLGFEIVPETLSAIAARANLIGLSSAERIRYELDQIMISPRAFSAFMGLNSVGLIAWIMPELYEGHDVAQPSFHHLDVLQHNLFTLDCIEQIIGEPRAYFPENHEIISSYLSDSNNVMLIKWAALFHDVGKPVTRKVLPDKQERITFYGHDEEGVRKFGEFADRLKWSKANRERVSKLVGMHMHPFHLCNVLQSEHVLSERAQLKLCRRANDELVGLFLVAMADSMAGQGVEKVAGVEETLAGLFNVVEKLNREKVTPVLTGPKLLTGHDLIDTLGISPGPQFREILEALDLAAIEGVVSDKEGAFNWVRNYLADKG